jgi:hypothetical protein
MFYFIEDVYFCLMDPECITEGDVSPLDKEAQGAVATGLILKRLIEPRSRVAEEDPVHSLTFVSTGVASPDLLGHHKDGCARNRVPGAAFEPNDSESFSPEIELALRFEF